MKAKDIGQVSVKVPKILELRPSYIEVTRQWWVPRVLCIGNPDNECMMRRRW